jgi:hypothetical protein
MVNVLISASLQQTEISLNCPQLTASAVSSFIVVLETFVNMLGMVVLKWGAPYEFLSTKYHYVN